MRDEVTVVTRLITSATLGTTVLYVLCVWTLTDQHQLPSAEMSNQSDPQADYEQLTNPDDNGYITVVGN